MRNITFAAYFRNAKARKTPGQTLFGGISKKIGRSLMCQFWLAWNLRFHCFTRP